MLLFLRRVSVRGDCRRLSVVKQFFPVRKNVAFYSVNANSSSSTTAQSTGPAMYSVAEINADGAISQKTVTKSSLLSDSKLNARDLIALLSGKSRRARPDILVRESSIVVCLCHIKAIIRVDRLLIFDPDDPVVRNTLPNLAKSIAQKPFLPHPFDYLEDSVDFELRALECILNLVCETYWNRATLIAPLVDGLIRNLASSKTPLPNALHQLLPMKDHLSNFEIETGMTRDVLNALLKNDEDLLGLLLSERKRRMGADPPLEAHRTVELMLENYCSHMVDISQEAYYLRKRIESVQSIVELTLDSHRNRLLYVSLQLSMGAIALSWITATAGFFGMNLPSGLEDMHGAFWSVTFGSTVGAGLVFLGMNTFLARISPNVDVKQGDFDIIFLHLDELQSIFHKGFGDKVFFTKSEFKEALRSIKISDEISELVWSSFESEKSRLTRQESSKELQKLFDINFLRRMGVRQPMHHNLKWFAKNDDGNNNQFQKLFENKPSQNMDVQKMVEYKNEKKKPWKRD